MQLRKAKLSDTQAILRILCLAHRDNYRRKLYFSSGRMTKRKLGRKIKHEIVIAAVDNKRVVGTISLKRRNSYFELNSLAVSPRYQNKGLGKRLMQYAERYSKKRRISKCVLYTLENHPWLPQYYKKQGYKKVKVIKGTRYRTEKYVKKIA
jgi:N-acetylglutamate synthase-like GNAT family acetyltransferase